MGEDLTATHRQEVRELVSQHQDVFVPSPGYTQLLHHDIVTPPGVRVRLKPYRLPETRMKAIEEAAAEMRRLNIIESPHSPWSSLIVAVPKPDGSLRVCKKVSKFSWERLATCPHSTLLRATGRCP